MTTEKKDTKKLFTIVGEELRCDFLPDNFGPVFLDVENWVCNFATKFIVGYSGALWEFVLTVEDGCAFMYPKLKEEVVSIRNISGVEEELPVYLAGLVVTSLSVLMVLELYEKKYGQDNNFERLIDIYHALIAKGQEIADKVGFSAAYFHIVD